VDQIPTGIVVTVIGGLILAGLIWFIRYAQRLFQKRDDKVGDAEGNLIPFSLDALPDLQQSCGKSSFRVDAGRCGFEARAETGQAVKGTALIVILQHQVHAAAGLTVWVSAENGGVNAIRWFAPVLTAYAEPKYQEIQPREADGRSYLFDIYPGEQYTCRYFFPYDEHTRGAKYMTCKSWDRELIFWWARGA
jgi:hypothetical protein